MSDLPSEVPIFALGTVLFPGGVLPLRIFEPRYLDMIKRCMANGTPFGVCSIKQGREVGQAAGIVTTAHSLILPISTCWKTACLVSKPVAVNDLK